ncbi:hypothetical protein GZ78_24665 [Endozoicomonas numazuensis]|uniref:Uncharacterized protein n=1 Tax=Endozoicomonas numazuensis TaxID=1137799 RepID=A0A081N9E4_9GAMM|nr:hypothetical protein GZ78_24665 [Endozoicomonas numazuensis]
MLYPVLPEEKNFENDDLGYLSSFSASVFQIKEHKTYGVDCSESTNESSSVFLFSGFYDAGNLLISGQHANKIKLHLRGLNTRGEPVESEEEGQWVIKVFTPKYPFGVGYIRNMDNAPKWKKDDIVSIRLEDGFGYSPLRYTTLDEDVAAKELVYVETYDTKNLTNNLVTIKHTNYKKHECSVEGCMKNELSRQPVFIKNVLYGFTSYCSGVSMCKIIPAEKNNILHYEPRPPKASSCIPLEVKSETTIIPSTSKVSYKTSEEALPIKTTQDRATPSKAPFSYSDTSPSPLISAWLRFYTGDLGEVGFLVIAMTAYIGLFFGVLFLSGA